MTGGMPATAAVDPVDGKLDVLPVTRREVREFIAERQWHPVRPGALFRLGVAAGEDLVGVVVVGKPQVHVSRDRRTAEVLRICVECDRPGALPLLYRAVGQTAAGMGYRQLIIYGGHGAGAEGLTQAGWKFRGPIEVLRFPETPTAAAERVARRWLWEVHQEGSAIASDPPTCRR
jgi:hypothetical protein